MLIILIALIVVASTCQNCVFNGVEYWSGQYLGYRRCCNGYWINCPFYDGSYHCEQAYCNCIGNNNPIVSFAVDNTSIIDSHYHLTDDNRLYTQYVTLAKFNEVKQIYYPMAVVHSTKVQNGDLIIWDGTDIGVSGNVVMEIQHYAIDHTHLNCCAAIKIGFSYYVKVCCGTGCCC